MNLNKLKPILTNTKRIALQCLHYKDEHVEATDSYCLWREKLPSKLDHEFSVNLVTGKLLDSPYPDTSKIIKDNPLTKIEHSQISIIIHQGQLYYKIQELVFDKIRTDKALSVFNLNMIQGFYTFEMYLDPLMKYLIIKNDTQLVLVLAVRIS